MTKPKTTRPLGDRLYARISPAQCEALHEAALSILERTGARLPLPSAVACLRDAGALVSDGDRVRVPRELVEWALERAPGTVTLHDRRGEPALVLDGTRTYYGPGSDCMSILDHRDGALRRPLLSDVRDAVRLVEALADLDFVTMRRWPWTSSTSSVPADSSSAPVIHDGTSASTGIRTSSSVRRGRPGRPRAPARSQIAPRSAWTRCSRPGPSQARVPRAASWPRWSKLPFGCRKGRRAPVVASAARSYLTVCPVALSRARRSR
jgi:hypothetical protein